MKKFFFVFLLFAVSSTIPILLAIAKTTPPPDVDHPLSPVDANKAVITGTADPFAQVMVTGGLYEIPPVEADEDGNFSITVALIQEMENTFYVQSVNSGSEPSEAVEVVIEEGEDVTAEYEAETGDDHTAPDAPEVEENPVETSEDVYTIEGTGEKNAKVIVNTVDSGEDVKADGTFEVQVALSGNNVKDTFNISLQDETGNLSSGLKVYITGIGEAGEVKGDEEADDEDEDNNENDDSGSQADFNDISDHWAENYIEELYALGAINGYGDGRFGPDDYVTRAQIVKIALLAFELPVSANNEDGFLDVGNGEWYEDYVNSAAGPLGIVNGYNDNSFKPNNNVTRGEALKIILESAGVEISFGSDNFNDVDSIIDWFSDYSAYAKEIGLVGGYSDGSFRGNQPITRAEVCKIVVELIEYLEDQSETE